MEGLKTNVFTTEVVNEFQVKEDKYITINEEFYLGGENDIFKGLEMNQIKLMTLCLAIADYQMQKLKHNRPDDHGDYTHIHFQVKKKNNKVFKLLFGSHSYLLTKIKKPIIVYVNGVLPVFSLTEDKNGMIDVSVCTCILKRYLDSDGQVLIKYTPVWTGDLLSTTRMSSLLLKLSLYRFLKMQESLGNKEKDNRSYMRIFISKTGFTEWTNCKNRHSQFLKEALMSIESENSVKIKYDYDIQEKVIVLILDRNDVVAHIKQNCRMAMGKFTGKKIGLMITDEEISYRMGM
ncbi:MAG: hypothetical protein ACRCZ0_06605 [Cetobacterium sp.]